MLDQLNTLIANYTYNVEIIEFLEKNYEIIDYILDNKLHDYYYYIGFYPNLKPADLLKAEQINQRYMVNGLLQNPNVSGNWLAKKLKSKDSIIAAKAAAHKNLPIKEFDNIKKLTNKTIIKALLSNPSCPKKYLNEYFYNEEDYTFDHTTTLLASVTINKNLPVELFKEILTDRNKFRYMDNMLKNVDVNKEHLEILKQQFEKTLDYARILNILSQNSYIKQNKDIQDFLCDSISDNMNYIYKANILNILVVFIDKNNIEKLVQKFNLTLLIGLIKNPNTPIKIVKDILLNTEKLYINNMYDGYTFSDDDILDIIINAKTPTNRPNVLRGERFYWIYKEKISNDVLNKLYILTKNEIYLNQTVKDIFLF